MLALSKIGTPFEGKAHKNKNIIYRLRSPPITAGRYPYVIVSESVEEIANSNNIVDVLTVDNLLLSHNSSSGSLMEKLKKKVRKGIGLEVTVARARKMDGFGVARWFAEIGKLYKLCHSLNCQFILSSGAGSFYEMVSGPCLDAILRHCDIDPQRHWEDMNSWLDSKLSGKVYLHNNAI